MTLVQGISILALFQKTSGVAMELLIIYFLPVETDSKLTTQQAKENAVTQLSKT